MAGSILGASLLASASIVSSDALSGYPATNWSDNRTTTQTGFATGATRRVVYDFGAAQTFSAVGIAKANVHTASADLVVEGSANGSTWTEVFSKSYSSIFDQVIYEEFTPVNYRYVRLSFSGHTGTLYISDLTLGAHLKIKGQPSGWTEPKNAHKDQIVSNVTRGNELAGLSFYSYPKEFKIHIANLTISESDALAWPLGIAVLSGPFYFKWANASEDGIDGAPAFCWLKNQLPQSPWSSLNRIDITIDCMGFV